MEKLQYRALRLVYSDFDSSFKRANMNTLKLTRIRKIALETFKILNKLTPSYILDLVKFRNANYSFRYQNLVETESYGRKSFRYAATHIWNSLPNEQRTTVTTDFKEFVRLIRTWEGTSCKYSMYSVKSQVDCKGQVSPSFDPHFRISSLIPLGRS